MPLLIPCSKALLSIHHHSSSSGKSLSPPLQAGEELHSPLSPYPGSSSRAAVVEQWRRHPGLNRRQGQQGPSASYPIFCWDEVLQGPQHQSTGQERGAVKKEQLPSSPSPPFKPTFLYIVTWNNITVVFSLLSLSKNNFFPTQRPGKGGHFRFLQWYLFICAAKISHAS